MVVALLVLLLLTSLGVSYIAVTKRHRDTAGRQAAGSQAFANAAAGVGEVLGRMSSPSSPEYIGQSSGAWSPGWGRYVVNDPGGSALDPRYDATTTDGLDNDSDSIVDEAGEHYPEMISRQFKLAAGKRLDYPWVKVRYKLNAANNILLFGDDDNNPLTPPKENLVRGMPELIVTALGRRPVGSKVLTVEAVKWPLPPTPGAVYAEGGVPLQGSAVRIDGRDHRAEAPFDTLPGAPSVPGIATPEDPGRILDGLSASAGRLVRGRGPVPSVGTSHSNLDLSAMADAWSRMANSTYPGGLSDPNTDGWGDGENLKIVHVKGNLSVAGGGSGAGVLVVDGDLLLGGTFRYRGVILCRGGVTLSGGDNATRIVGCLLAQGSLADTEALGGDVEILYSSAMIGELYALTQYEVSSWTDQ
jgi:hypothetical protein